MKETACFIPVLNEITLNNQSLENGDFVQCINCGRLMLVNIGTEECPGCKKHSLSWADSQQEYGLDGSQLKEKGYELLDKIS